MLRLGDPRARRARARRRGGRRRLRPPRRGARREARPAPAARARPAHAGGRRCSPHGEPQAAARLAADVGRAGGRRSARGCRPPSRSPSPAARSPPRASANEAIAVLREPRPSSTRAAPLRARDASAASCDASGARAEPRGPATPDDTGVAAALTKREVARDRTGAAGPEPATSGVTERASTAACALRSALYSSGDAQDQRLPR